MTKIGNAERETLRSSADAASKLLAALREQRAKLDDRIGRLQAVVEAWESLSGKRRATETGNNEQPMKRRVKKGQVPAHIDQVLQTGGEYDEPELRKAIEEQFGAVYGRATVYTSLRRGLKEHRYVKNGKKWGFNQMKKLQQIA